MDVLHDAQRNETLQQVLGWRERIVATSMFSSFITFTFTFCMVSGTRIQSWTAWLRRI